jgi:hypothetical protein
MRHREANEQRYKENPRSWILQKKTKAKENKSCTILVGDISIVLNSPLI